MQTTLRYRVSTTNVQGYVGLMDFPAGTTEQQACADFDAQSEKSGVLFVALFVSDVGTEPKDWKALSTSLSRI